MNWRPWNETPEDRARQNTAKVAIWLKQKCDITDLSERLYEIDWVFHRDGRPIAFAEYKYRGKRYETVILSLAKFDRGCRLAQRTGLPFLLFVEWADEGLHYARLDKRAFRVEMGGNFRGQNGDIEPVIHVPATDFNKL